MTQQCKSAKNGKFDTSKQEFELKFVALAGVDYTKKEVKMQTMGRCETVAKRSLNLSKNIRPVRQSDVLTELNCCFEARMIQR